MVKYDQPQSYVWPADYNWIKPHHADMSTVSHVNSPVSSTGNTKSTYYIHRSGNHNVERN